MLSLLAMLSCCLCLQLLPTLAPTRSKKDEETACLWVLMPALMPTNNPLSKACLVDVMYDLPSDFTLAMASIAQAPEPEMVTPR